MIDIGNQKIDVTCPNCNAKISISMKQIANQVEIACNSCKVNIKLTDNNGATKQFVRKFNSIFDKFGK